MNKTVGNIIQQQEIAPGIFSMMIETEVALTAKPGQFVSLYCHDTTKMLPRPISICQIDEKEMTIRIVYRVAGKGTNEFSTYKNGDVIELMGPLGNGFPVDEVDPWDRVILLGGGIGIPPMVGVAQALEKRGIRRVSVMGYKDDNTFLLKELKAVCESHIATEDGSLGTKGTIIDALNKKEINGDVIFACGPTPMLSAVKKYAKMNGITCYISMEERMACGIGACLGCVCESTNVDDHSKVNNKRVCKDGPVFLAEDISL